MKNKYKAVLFGTAVMVGGAGVKLAGDKLRGYFQKKLQDKVNQTAPTGEVCKKNIDASFIMMSEKNGNYNLDQFTEVTMDETERDECKKIISNLLGGGIYNGVFQLGFEGLLVCDMPINELCKVANDPSLMRGYIRRNGRISDQAAFSEAGMDSMAPMLAYQCMAMVTSQYYQQIIADKFFLIESKIDSIFNFLVEEDKAILKHALSVFKDLSLKTSYDIADKMNVDTLSNQVNIIREKFKSLLLKIGVIESDYAWTDEKEAKKKINAFRASRYFDYLPIVLNSEAVCLIASVLSLKIARCLGNQEDVNMYLKRIDVDFGDNYTSQFRRIKHDVLEYIQQEEKAAWFNKDSLRKMKEDIGKQFLQAEEFMMNLQRQFNYNTKQLIRIDENGALKKYIYISPINQD